MGIKASVNNGSGWGNPVMLTGAHPANYTPRTAIDENGNAAVAWKGGEFLASDYNDADKAGMVSGALYMRRYDGSGWGDAVMLTPTGKGRAVSDYAMAMLGGKPYMLAALGRNTDEGNGLDTEHALAAVGYASDDCPMLVESSVLASAPQLVSFGGKLFGAALVKEGGATEEGDTTELKTDVHLYHVSTNGMIDDLGGMGLGKRNIADFRLVKSDKAMALVWRESTQILNEQTGQPRHHAERLRCAVALYGGQRWQYCIFHLLPAAYRQGGKWARHIVLRRLSARREQHDGRSDAVRQRYGRRQRGGEHQLFRQRLYHPPCRN